MKLAEFFVGLGFDFSGGPELDKLDKALNSLAGDASKLLAGFGSVTAGMTVMLNQALHTADAFRVFTAVTGLASDQLKKWQFAAASAGVGGDELMGVIKQLQQGRIDIMMGEGNIKGWQLLGIAPSENPFDTLRDLKKRIEGLDPALAANLLSKAGVSESVFALLKLSNEEFDALDAKYQMSITQQKELNAVSKSWRELLFLFKSAGESIMADLVTPLQPLLKWLQKGVGLLASFGQWLSKDTLAAKVMRIVLITVALAVVAVTAALTVLIAVIGALTLASAALSASLSPLWPIIWGIAAIVAVAVGAIAAFVLVVQDLWVTLQGGDSVINDVFIKPWQPLANILDDLIEKLLKFLGIWESVKKGAEWLYTKATGGTTLSESDLKKMDEVNKRYKEYQAKKLLPGGGSSPAPAPTVSPAIDATARLTDAALAPSVNANRSTTVSQENNIEVNVNGEHGDAHSTGRIVSDNLKQSLSNAAYQLPVPAY